MNLPIHLPLALFAALALAPGAGAAPGASASAANRASGRWYDGERAADQLQRKLDHAVGRRQPIPSAEAFIAGAATRSSFSGRVYHVRCGDAPVVTSATWFHARLRELRSH